MLGMVCTYLVAMCEFKFLGGLSVVVVVDVVDVPEKEMDGAL